MRTLAEEDPVCPTCRAKRHSANVCERMMLCEDTFDSMAQVMPILAQVGITGMTPAMAAHNAALEIKRLRALDSGFALT